MRAGLIRSHTNFRRLWIGQSISQVGTAISTLAVPLIAVLTLHATPVQVSVLYAVEFAPYVLIGLPAGVWVDRLRRQRIMIVTDLIRAAALLTIPLAAATGGLNLPVLYAVVLAIGTATVFFEVAYQAYLPAVVGRDQLVEANGRLTASRSVASAAGPTGAGWIIAALTAPIAIIADAISYLCSAAFVATIRTAEPSAPARSEGRSLRREIGEGLRLVFGDRLLRTLTIYSAASSMCISMTFPVEILFLVHTVGLTSSSIGVLFGVTSLGSVLGAFVGAPLRRRLGDVPALMVASLGAGLFLLLVPLTAPGVRLALFVLGVGMASCCIVANNVVNIALMQRRCPDRLLGRMFATSRFVSWSTPPIGALLGGVLGTAIGLRSTLLLAAVAFVAAATGLAVSLSRPALRRAGDEAIPDPAAVEPSALDPAALEPAVSDAGGQ